MTLHEDGGLEDRLRRLSDEAAEIGSPFYARLCALMADDAAAGGPTEAVLGPTATLPFGDYHAFRVLDGVHWLVLEGRLPALEARYDSTGGDSDADAAWPHIREVLREPPPEIIDMLSHPIQTNEPSRSAALVVGFLEVARRTALPLHILELGSSAGLNLHFDRFRYETDGAAFGPSDSPVRFTDYWLGATPSFDAPLEVADRRGCDLNPIDLRIPSERTRLLSYVWPDETARFALNAAAVEVASSDPVAIDRAPAADWLDRELAGGPVPGRATVVFHSVFWNYLDDQTKQSITRCIEATGAASTDDAPVAWLRYEQEDVDVGACDVRLRLWPGGDDRVLATGSHHFHPVTMNASG